MAYGLHKETVTVIIMLYKNTKVKVHSMDGDKEFFDIFGSVLQGDTLSQYLFITSEVLQMLVDLMKENGFRLAKARSRTYLA